MNLHVIAYPELAPADMELIQACRKEHNSLYPIIGAHFTLVFSVTDVSLPDFAAEIKQQLADTKAIDFCFRSATINKDSFSDNYDAFLVPDEGFSRISKLHDRLYANNLARHHRLDVSYIPHLSIANSTNPQHIKQLVSQWNEKDFAIRGRITALDIMNYENRVITTMERIPLK